MHWSEIINEYEWELEEHGQNFSNNQSFKSLNISEIFKYNWKKNN